MRQKMTLEYLKKMLIALNEISAPDRQEHSSLALLKYIYDSTNDKEIIKLFKNVNNIDDILMWEGVSYEI